MTAKHSASRLGVLDPVSGSDAVNKTYADSHGGGGGGGGGVTSTYSQAIGNGSATSIAVNHGLNTRDVQISVYDAVTYEDVNCDKFRTGTNIVTLVFGTAPAANSLIVAVTAGGTQPKPLVARCITHGDETYTIASGNVTQINGTTVDGIALAVGDRILIHTAPASSGAGSWGSTQPGNGLYMVTANTTNLTVARAPEFTGNPAGQTVVISGGDWFPSCAFRCAIPSNPASFFTYGTTSMQFLLVDTPNLVSTNSTNTLTNKRIVKRITSPTVGATVTINSDTTDVALLAGLNQGTTIAAPSGTPTDGQPLTIRITDDGTARALTWNAIWHAVGVVLPTVTVVGKVIYVGAMYNAALAKWDVIAVTQEA